MNRANVLLTGGTGFLGKIALRELLDRSRELDLDRVFVLVRAPSQEAAELRLAREVFGSDGLRGLSSSARETVVAVRGDLHQVGLGIAAETSKLLSAEVTHVLHCAASIEFDLPLSEATQINVAGALEVMNLCRGFERRPILTQVSTAYVHPHRGNRVLEEKLVPLPRPASEIYEEIGSGAFSEASLLRETGHPNTYTLTKCLAEHLLAERGAAQVLRILRPSIISACLERPFPGWIDSGAAFAGFVAMLGTGQLQAVSARPEVALDVVPCDIVAKRLVELAFAPASAPSEAPEIRQCVAGPDASCSIAACRRAITDYFGLHPVARGPRIRFVGERSRAFRLADFALHTVPTKLALRVSKLTGNSRRESAARRSLERIRALNRTFAYFTHRDFCFESSLPPISIRPESYLELVCRGVHRHLLRGSEREVQLAGIDAPAPRIPHLSISDRLSLLLSRWAARRLTTSVTFDREGFATAIEGLPRCVFATRPDRALDRRFLALALRSSPQLRTGRVAIAEDEGDLRGLLATGGSPILGAEIRPQQLETLGPLSLVPVTAYYEDDAFSGLQGFAFWRHVLRGGGPAGRVHLRAGPALQQHEAGSAEALELHFAAAETEDTGSLRSWMRALPGDLEASRLIAAIEDRGGQVVRGKQEGNGAAADLLPNWCWRFLPELARRSPERRDLGERAARVSHLLPESAQRPLEDPEFDPLLAELLRRIDHP